MNSETNTRTPAKPRLSQREKATLEAFATACGISTKMALVVRDDLGLVKLALPDLRRSRR